MADEYRRMNHAQYQNCGLVIRNYFFEEIITNKEGVEVIWAPCGFKTGLGPRTTGNIKIANQRQWLSAFLSWLNDADSYHGERESFSRMAPECGEDLFLQSTAGFIQEWSTSLYSIAMEGCVFALYPAGNAPEPIRLYDALEVGCILISLHHEFLISSKALELIEPVPFPILNSVNELPAFLKTMKNKMLTPPGEINEMQACCIFW